jgi:hypothetical protein
MIRSVALCTVLALAAAVPASAQESDQIVLTRNVLEAIRTNTAALQRNAQIMETFSNRLERVEAATRTIPPSVEGLRTDIIAIRAGLDRLVAGSGQKRPAASLRFAPFACGNESEAACAVNACKSVGYGNGFALAVNRTGTGANVRPSSVAEATCYD